MDNLIFIFAIVFALLVIHAIISIDKIKRAREVGKKLYKRNRYYALIAKVFVKNLPK